jgi:hypothetical protein
LGHSIRDIQNLASRRLITICLCDYLTQLDRDWFDTTEELRDIARSDEVTEICADIVIDATQPLDVRGNAAIALGTANSSMCLDALRRLAQNDANGALHEAVLDALEPAFSRAVDDIREGYYGGMCPGALESLIEDDVVLNEYENVSPLWTPVLRMFRRYRAADRLEDVLRDLNPNHKTIVDSANQGSLFQRS